MKVNHIPLHCPHCQQRLVFIDSGYKCQGCLRDYPVRDGVICFLDKQDEFYEGAYDATIKITFNSKASLKAFLYFYVYKEPYFNAIHKYAQAPMTILDIGCGGGTKYLAQKGTVAGLDLSFASLQKASRIYHRAVQADALQLPFPDNTFDLITSSYTFEHFHREDKYPLLEQMHRVLKPNGRIILIFDCDNDNPLFRWLKKDKKLYQECIVENDHHYGLQLPRDNLDLINKANFSLLEYRGLNKTMLQYLPVYGWIIKYGSKSRMIFFITGLASFVSKRKVLWVFYHTLINWFDRLVERWFPLNYARVLLVIAEKRQRGNING